MCDNKTNIGVAVWPAESVDCYLDEIPSFVKTELEQLYGNSFSSLPFFQAFRAIENVRTYVVRKNGNPAVILLFRHKGRRIDVLNEMIQLDEMEIRRFVNYVFTNFASVAIISFKAIQADIQRLPFPYQRHNSKENFVITLPDSPEEYTSRIGASTRRNIKRYMKKIVQDYPTFGYTFYRNEEIDEQKIREIIRLSELRISAKKRRFGISEEDVQQILGLARRCGLVNVITIDGRLCAGTITCCTEDNCLALVNAHSTEYDEYWLGTLCYYLTICESIVRGARKFHMGEGRYDYKSRLLGVRQDMDHVEIYRSYAGALFNADQVAQTFFKSRLRKTKVWLLDHEKSLISQLILRTVFLFRN